MDLELKLKDIFKNKRTLTIKTRDGQTVIENNRKSRFIMKDAAELIKKLKEHGIPVDSEIAFHSLTPICSKSLACIRECGLTLIDS